MLIVCVFFSVYVFSDFFFFKQKTAYEMRISDWSSDVCSSDLRPDGLRLSRVRVPIGLIGIIYESRPNVTADAAALCVRAGNAALLREIGRASCRERVCQYV